MDSQSTVEELKQTLNYLRLHRDCECCGKEMTLFSERPAGNKWAHTATKDVLCDHEDCLVFEKVYAGMDLAQARIEAKIEAEELFAKLSVN